MPIAQAAAAVTKTAADPVEYSVANNRQQYPGSRQDWSSESIVRYFTKVMRKLKVRRETSAERIVRLYT